MELHVPYSMVMTHVTYSSPYEMDHHIAYAIIKSIRRSLNNKEYSCYDLITARYLIENESRNQQREEIHDTQPKLGKPIQSLDDK